MPLSKMLFPGMTDGKVWITKAGSQVRLTDLGDEHLQNAIDMVSRRLERQQEQLAYLVSESHSRILKKAEEVKMKRKMSTLAEDKPRFFREDD